jgi:acetyl-CoA carboxylase biotin carboxyl carrier protein
MYEDSVDLDRLAALIRLVETRGLAELVVEENGCRYVIRGARAPGRAGATPITTPGPVAAPEPPEADDRIAVVAPMVGVFYRAPAPTERPYVEVGDPVEEGQTIGIIEAMKVFSEVPSDASGIVDEIPVADGELVKPGQPLLYVRPREPEDASHG